MAVQDQGGPLEAGFGRCGVFVCLLTPLVLVTVKYLRFLYCIDRRFGAWVETVGMDDGESTGHASCISDSSMQMQHNDGHVVPETVMLMKRSARYVMCTIVPVLRKRGAWLEGDLGYHC